MLDGATVGHAELGHERPDLAEAHPDIKRAALGGFRFQRRVAERVIGTPEVKIVIESLADTREEEILAVVVPPEPPPPPKPDLAEPDSARMKFQLDSPRLSAGRVEEIVSGRLTIDGWVLSRSPIVAMEVWLAGQRLGDAHHGLARQDVAAAFPDWPNAERGGFAFHCPPRGLRDGVHEARLITRCEDGYSHEIAFQVEVKRSDTEREAVSIRRRLAFTGQTLLRDTLRRLDVAPRFDIVLRQGAAGAAATLLTLRSIAAQVLDDWRVTILCDAGTEAAEAAVTTLGGEFAARATILAPEDAGWRAPLGAADHFVMPLTPGDELGVDALAELAVAHGLHPDAEALYADETRISPVSLERKAFLKPDFSPDLLLSTNYIGRPWVVLGHVLAGLGATAATLAEAGEYELILRCAERAGQFQHVPKLLCRRGAATLDTPETDRAALTRAFERQAIQATIEDGALPGLFRVRRTAPVAGKVSIIIPTRAARGLIGVCLKTLREHTAYKNFEIVVLDNIPVTEPAWLSHVHRTADKVERIDEPFNWSRFNNRAAARADGEFLLFLNDDIEIIDPDWLDTLLREVARPEVGVVGARLLYPNRTVQHAGMFLATNGVARHAFRFAAEDDPGYFGLALSQRNVSAVTGACFMVRRGVFDQLGGFDEAHEVVNNDLDFCLRARRAGYLVIYTPYATLIHHEQASRDRMSDVYDTSHFDSAWADVFTAGDTYFNPRLFRHADDHRPDDEPVEPVFSGRPLFDAAAIERLLVIKLDHIGDFVTALPSIRRLKALFPRARITVLAAPAAQSFAAFEPAIDEFIAFEFFHVKSGLGRKEVTEADLAELGRRLTPYRFDLAIDLRKQPDTREVLRICGARYMAGFDHQARFNFLDIALEWESDRGLHNKRNHVSDDLLNLVEAVGQATTSHQPRLEVPETMARAAREALPEPIQALFAKPVVFVHPGVGSAVKQWPLGHFSALINLLIARHGVSVVVIGSPDEAELANTVIAGVRERTAIGSLVGQTPLRDLPALLANATLFIGNDSGPKHIAAAVGVPTIGIHSGVVDTMEWGPVGPTAIALKRGMACSPCYLARVEDCPRDLACLKALEPTLVYEAAVAMLGRPSTAPKEKEPPMTSPAKPPTRKRAAGARKRGTA
jgi:ADP-heptose:LPS heptosyltransferase/GT2 family glycosyltransferase